MSDWPGGRPGWKPPPAKNEAELHAAQEKFLTWVTGKWANAEPKEVVATFWKAFREGDEAVTYAGILRTGGKTENVGGESGRTNYEWTIHMPYNPKYPDSSKLWLDVEVRGTPAWITKVDANLSID